MHVVFWNLQKSELKSLYLGKPLSIWVLCCVSVVVCRNIIVWIKFSGKFIFTRRCSVESSELFGKFASEFHTFANHYYIEYPCSLQLWFVEISSSACNFLQSSLLVRNFVDSHCFLHSYCFEVVIVGFSLNILVWIWDSFWISISILVSTSLSILIPALSLLRKLKKQRECFAPHCRRFSFGMDKTWML